MQKKLIALAIAAAFSAPAFAEVSLYGVVDAALVQRSDTGAKSDMLAISGGLAASRLGVTGAEDLDNGMKAVVKLEYGLDVETNSTVGVDSTGQALAPTATTMNARQQMLALAGGFGTVATGFLQTTGYDWQVKYDPTAGSAVSPLQKVNSGFLIGSAAAAARAPRALAYISPDMNGLSFAVNYTTSFDNMLGNLTIPTGTSTGLKTTATLASVNYAAGPLAVGGVYAKTSNASTGATTNTDMGVGGSYDLGAAKLFATYQNDKSSAAGAKTVTAMSVSAVAPVGSGAVAGSYAKSAYGATGSIGDQTSYTVAYLQGLSKSTTAYAAYNNVTTKAAGGDTKTTILAVGLNKKF